jgi:hypothetical protein
MMKLRHSLFPYIVIGVTLATAAPAQAQQSIAVTPESVQQFRADLNAVLGASSAVFSAIKFNKPLERVNAARAKLQNTTDQELEWTFAKGGVPDLTEAKAQVQQWVTDMPGILARQAQRKAQPVSTTTTTSRGGTISLTIDASYGIAIEGLPDKEELYPPCENVVHSSDFTFAMLNVASALRIIGIVADRLCTFTVLGQNNSIACTITDLATEAAQFAFDLADFCGGEEDSRTIEGTFNRVGTVHDKLVAGFNNTQTMALRFTIEQSLASSSPMAFLAIPNAYGGRLEEVRSIVVETMGNAQRAGVSVGTAQMDLDFADKLKSAGDYRGAYKRYKMAYQQACP